MTERAARFLCAYNKIDQTLRSVYGYKPNMSFTDIVRRTVPVSFVCARYEDDLLDYGRLRNAIVHKNFDNQAIAEPYEETVRKFEHICSLLSTPPVAAEIFGSDVRCVPPDTTLAAAIRIMSKTGYSNLPVCEDGKLLGAVGNKTVLMQVAALLETPEKISVEKIYPVLNPDYYLVLPKTATLPELCDKFYKNRKLLAVLITEKGALTSPVAIVTNADVSRMENILGDYE